MAGSVAPAYQEWIVFAIVAAAALSVAVTTFRFFLAEPLSRWMLRRGKVSAAMKLRAQAEGAGCGSTCGGAGKKGCQ